MISEFLIFWFWSEPEVGIIVYISFWVPMNVDYRVMVYL
jgi:hypothetical protein